MNGNGPFVTVLTPVYNCGEYIEQCIESVLAQTFKNYEYIIINNCSTDNTLDIALRYAAKDSRIRVHDNTEFLGVIENHNLAFGLLSPAAKYCKVVSADDFIFPDYLERMTAFMEAHPSVGIAGCYELVGKHVQHVGLEYERSILSGREVCRDTLLGIRLGLRHLLGSPTSLLYSADLVRKSPAFYPNSSPHADVSACLKWLHDRDYGFVHQVMAYARIRATSQSSRSLKLGLHKLTQVSNLREYGNLYLTPAELDARMSGAVDEYYSWLVKRIYENRGDKKFWDLQKEGLKEVGLTFSRTRLYKTAVFRAFKEFAGSPGNAFRKVLGMKTATDEIEAKYYDD